MSFNDWMPLAPVLVFAVLGWKALSTIAALSGGSNRARDRERRDADRLVEHLIEKAQCPPETAARIHATERAAQSRLDGKLEESWVHQPDNDKVPAAQPEEDNYA